MEEQAVAPGYKRHPFPPAIIGHASQGAAMRGAPERRASAAQGAA